MSLLLSGAKTIVFAGTEMQCLEIYTGEAYTIGLNFTDAGGSPVNITGWTFATAAAYYDVATVTYNDALGEIDLGNITVYAGSPTQPSGLTTVAVNPPGGTGYLYIPTDLADGTGGRPAPALVNGKSDPSVLVIVTVEVERTDAVSGLQNISKEPIGFVVRYQ